MSKGTASGTSTRISSRCQEPTSLHLPLAQVWYHIRAWVVHHYSAQPPPRHRALDSHSLSMDRPYQLGPTCLEALLVWDRHQLWIMHTSSILVFRETRGLSETMHHLLLGLLCHKAMLLIRDTYRIMAKIDECLCRSSDSHVLLCSVSFLFAFNWQCISFTILTFTKKEMGLYLLHIQCLSASFRTSILVLILLYFVKDFQKFYTRLEEHILGKNYYFC